jgi:hypothetical protein
MLPAAVLRPASGHDRVPIREACEIRDRGAVREGTVWNISRLGLYLATPSPIPAVGQRLAIVFPLDEKPGPIVCVARVAWRNPPSLVIEGLGTTALGLPPGCGLAFAEITSEDLARIERRLLAIMAP